MLTARSVWEVVLRTARAWRPGLPDVLASWIAARMAVLGALALAHYLELPARVGLLGWDASYYADIAAEGYRTDAPEATRFFPLVPLAARAVEFLVPGLSAGGALLLVTNVGAIVYTLLLYRLALEEGLGQATALRAVWLLTLAPFAFVLVMGYAEAVYGALTVAFMSSLRCQAWRRAAIFGLLAGTCRPLAVVLAVVALVEAARRLQGVRAGEALGRVAAVLAPLAGVGIYLAYIGVLTGRPLLPFGVQSDERLRGTVVGNPVTVAVRNVSGALTGDLVGSGLHVAWLLVFVCLLYAVVRTLPASYAVLAGSTLALAATSDSFASLERYAWSAFPFFMALAGLTRRAWLYALVLAASTAGLTAYALLTFANRYVP